MEPGSCVGVSHQGQLGRLTQSSADINNVGSISQALYAKGNPNYDELEASRWQAAQVSTLSVCNFAGRILIGSFICPSTSLSSLISYTRINCGLDPNSPTSPSCILFLHRFNALCRLSIVCHQHQRRCTSLESNRATWARIRWSVRHCPYDYH